MSQKQLINALKKHLATYEKEQNLQKKKQLLVTIKNHYKVIKTELEHSEVNYKNVFLEKQLQRILRTIQSYDSQILAKEQQVKQSSMQRYSSFKNVKTQEDLIKTMLQKTLQSQDFKISDKEFQKAYQRIIKIKDIVVDIEKLVEEEGHHIDRISEQMEVVYTNAEQAKQQLVVAEKHSNHARINKIRLAIIACVTGFGGLFFGYLGVFAGLFGGVGISRMLTKK